MVVHVVCFGHRCCPDAPARFKEFASPDVVLRSTTAGRGKSLLLALPESLDQSRISFDSVKNYANDRPAFNASSQFLLSSFESGFSRCSSRQLVFDNTATRLTEVLVLVFEPKRVYVGPGERPANRRMSRIRALTTRLVFMLNLF